MVTQTRSKQYQVMKVSDMNVQSCLSQWQDNKELWSSLGDFTPSTDTETMLAKCIMSLFGEVKSLQKQLCEFQTNLVNPMKTRLQELDVAQSDLLINQGKVEQYQRRDTLIISGLEMRENETVDQVKSSVVEILNHSGVQVSQGDLSAVHRNAKEPKIVKKGDSQIKIPPSITVKLYNLNKKDDILRNYKNFDRGQNKKRKVRVYQSLCPWYKEVKDLVNEYCNTHRLTIAWAHWRSASCGLAIKLKDSNRVITKVHCLDDFKTQLNPTE